MIGKTSKEHQMSISDVALESFIDMNHELVLLSKQIDWDAVESEFAEYCFLDNGRPSVPLRKMVGMMLLKNIYSLTYTLEFEFAHPKPDQIEFKSE